MEATSVIDRLEAEIPHAIHLSLQVNRRHIRFTLQEPGRRDVASIFGENEITRDAHTGVNDPIIRRRETDQITQPISLGDFPMPFADAPWHYGPPPAADGNPVPLIYVWDPSVSTFVVKS